MNFFFHPRYSMGGILSLFLLVTLASDLRAEDDIVIPKPYSADRYEPIWKKSPFSLPSAAEEAPAGFTENLALAGVIKIDDTYYAAIVDKTTQKRELISSVPNEQGLRLLKTESSDDLTKVSVTLQKGDESKTLRYDQAFLQSSANQAPAGQTTANAQPQGGGPVVQNPSVPPPTARPPRRRLIPSVPTNASSMGNGQQPNNPANAPNRPR